MRSLPRLLTRFASDTRGAVNIEWVAITSGILLLGIAVIYSIYSAGVTPVVNDMNTTLADLSGEL